MLTDVSELGIQSVVQTVSQYVERGVSKLRDLHDHTLRRDQEQILINGIAESLQIQTEKELRMKLNGEPSNEEEAAYLPLQTVKVTNEIDKKSQKQHS